MKQILKITASITIILLMTNATLLAQDVKRSRRFKDENGCF